MNVSMFTGFEGRINRAKWWLGTIILAVIAVILTWILSAIIGVSLIAPGGTTLAADTINSYVRRLAIVQLIVFVILVYPWLSLMIKRLNDRDRPSWYAYVFLAPSVLSIIFGLLGLTMTTIDVGGVSTPNQSALGWIINILMFVIGVWALIELGILKGTTGPNQHGPDPLAAP
jgi:uncharacterized membrane protein YhaH (DUF805 family)